MKRIATLLMLAGAALVSGCALFAERALPAPPPTLFEDNAFAAPSQPVDVAQVFALSPAMKQYLERDIAAQIHRHGRQQALVDALYDRARLQLDYDAETTLNAAEAFDARAGNCLSLVVMTAALAKHLDLPVTYQVLRGFESWSRDGDLSLINGHVNITVARRLVDRIPGSDPGMQIRLNFGAPPAWRAALHAVPERTIVAMFMNNRAAETLVRGALDDAYAYAREALLQDPGYLGAYNTLGVIYQRRGLAAAAERAYRLALEREPDYRPTLRNLARLYEQQGRGAEAAPLNARLARIEQVPPFHYLDLGRAAIANGDYRAGRDLILREMKRDPDYHELHFWLAVALAGLGDSAGAREHLALAMDNSTTRREHAIYAGKLERLKSANRAN